MDPAITFAIGFFVGLIFALGLVLALIKVGERTVHRKLDRAHDLIDKTRGIILDDSEEARLRLVADIEDDLA